MPAEAPPVDKGLETLKRLQRQVNAVMAQVELGNMVSDASLCDQYQPGIVRCDLIIGDFAIVDLNKPYGC